MSEYYYLHSPSIVVDDSDPAIRYNGTWNAANETVIQTAVFEDQTPLLNTLHVLPVFSGSFSYDFTGEGISVFAFAPDDSTSECFLDGNQLPFDSNATKAQFGQSRPVCQAFGLPDNVAHTIFVNVSVPPQQIPEDYGPVSGFAFDYMLVQPPSSLSLWDNGTQDLLLPVANFADIQQTTNLKSNTELFLVGNDQHSIANISRGWKFDAKNGFNTTTPGSQFNVTFTGTSLWWYGYVSDEPGALANAKFSIDGGAHSTFETIGSASKSQTLLFRTPVLQMATHLLTVVSDGGNKTLPLTLQSLIIRKSTPSPSSSTALFPSITISKTPTPPVKTNHKSPSGIIGGIAGGVIFLLLVASGAFMLTRWTRRRSKYTQTGPHSTAVVREPFPAPAEESVQIYVPRKAQPGQQNIGNPLMQHFVLLEPPETKWTRRHTISGHMTGSSIIVGQQQDSLGFQCSQPLIRADLEARPATENISSEQPVSQLGNILSPTALDIVSCTTLPAAQIVRYEDNGLRFPSVSELPPLYSTH